MHTKDKIKIVYADKGYPGSPNRNFLALNKIKDGIMRKDEKYFRYYVQAICFQFKKKGQDS